MRGPLLVQREIGRVIRRRLLGHLGLGRAAVLDVHVVRGRTAVLGRALGAQVVLGLHVHGLLIPCVRHGTLFRFGLGLRPLLQLLDDRALKQLRLEPELGRQPVRVAADIAQEVRRGVGQGIDALADAAGVLDRVGKTTRASPRAASRISCE